MNKTAPEYLSTGSLSTSFQYAFRRWYEILFPFASVLFQLKITITHMWLSWRKIMHKPMKILILIIATVLAYYLKQISKLFLFATHSHKSQRIYLKIFWFQTHHSNPMDVLFLFCREFLTNCIHNIRDLISSPLRYCLSLSPQKWFISIKFLQ